MKAVNFLPESCLYVHNCAYDFMDRSEMTSLGVKGDTERGYCRPLGSQEMEGASGTSFRMWAFALLLDADKQSPFSLSSHERLLLGL